MLWLSHCIALRLLQLKLPSPTLTIIMFYFKCHPRCYHLYSIQSIHHNFFTIYAKMCILQLVNTLYRIVFIVYNPFSVLLPSSFVYISYITHQNMYQWKIFSNNNNNNERKTKLRRRRWRKKLIIYMMVNLVVRYDLVNLCKH